MNSTSRLTLTILCLSVFACKSSPAPEFGLPAGSERIPFVLTDHNNVSIEAILNKVDTVHLMLHTAASNVTITQEAAKSIVSIDWDTQEEVNTWGGEASAMYSKANSLTIGRQMWDSLAIWETQNSGPATDGKFGPNLFSGKVLEFNFDEQTLIVHDSLPTKTSDFVQLPLRFEDGFMFIEATSIIDGVDYENSFLIHSGFGGSILYDDAFVTESNIGTQIEITDEKELKDSYGNILKTKKGIIPEFVIGDVSLQNMPVGFFEGSIGRQQMSVLGGDVLKRFHIILTVDRKHIFLKPNSLLHSDYSVI